MTEDASGRAVELLLSNLLANIERLQLGLAAHKQVVAENAPQLKALIADRERLLKDSQAKNLASARLRAVEFLRGRKYEELAQLLGAIVSGSVEEPDLRK
jgi:capsule polysaccharide export protein KpsE/RkpR